MNKFTKFKKLKESIKLVSSNPLEALNSLDAKGDIKFAIEDEEGFMNIDGKRMTKDEYQVYSRNNYKINITVQFV